MNSLPLSANSADSLMTLEEAEKLAAKPELTEVDARKIFAWKNNQNHVAELKKGVINYLDFANRSYKVFLKAFNAYPHLYSEYYPMRINEKCTQYEGKVYNAFTHQNDLGETIQEFSQKRVKK